MALPPLRSLGLSAKLLGIVVGVSLTGVLISSFLVLTLQRRELIDSARTASAHLSGAVEASLEHAMRNNDWAVVDDIARNVATRGGVERVLVLDPQGVARVSSMPGQVGTRIDRADPVCTNCHVGAEPPGVRTVVTQWQGHEALFSISPLHNEPTCRACHGTDRPILGYLLIQTPLTELRNQLRASFWRMAAVAVATLVLLAGLMHLALRKHVTRPVRALVGGLAEVGAGNLDCRVHVASRDELGELAVAFDAMRRQLSASRTEIERRNRELAMLNEVAVAASERLELQQILDLGLDIVVNRLGMQAGLIYLHDPETDHYTLRASLGVTPVQVAEIARRRERPGLNLSQQVAASAQVIFIPDLATDPRFEGIWGQGEHRSYVKLPLKAKGAVVGNMGLIGRADEMLSESQVRVLESVGHEIGIAIDNARLFTETRRGEREATALYELGARISASLELDQVLETIAAGARDVLAADLGLVGLLGEQGETVEVRAVAGAWGEALQGQRIAVGKEETAVCSRLGRELFREPGSTTAASYVAVPMERAGRLRGLVAVASREPRRFAAEDERLLARLAQTVVVAIENAQLYERVRRVAVLEERERLAREMHDNLAQSLGYLNLKASLTDCLLESGRIDEGRANLNELKQLTMLAYRDVREAIFNLRTTASLGSGFVPTLREYLEEYRAHYGVAAELQAGGEALAGLPVDTGVQITRIIQEALTNVRRHAGTDRAVVRVTEENGSLCITIEDHGCGFDVARVTAEGRQCFGLQVMRERVAGVGGELTLESWPGQGTRVRVRVPLAAAE